MDRFPPDTRVKALPIQRELGGRSAFFHGILLFTPPQYLGKPNPLPSCP